MSDAVSRPFRLIALDLDGTVLGPDGKVSPRTRAAVHAALASGWLVCFATGRNWTESREVLQALDHYPTAVFAGGATIIDTGRDVLLHRTLMQPELAAAVCGFIERHGHAALALQETASAGVDYVLSADYAITDSTRFWMKFTGSRVREVPSLATYRHEHTIRVGVVAPPAAVAAMADELLAAFGDRVAYHVVSVASHGIDVLEIFDPAVNKWQGILRLAEHHGIDPAEIICVGDDVNDLPMLREAGLGVAMGNARDDVKAAANRVIGSNSEDGLAIFLEELAATRQVASTR